MKNKIKRFNEKLVSKHATIGYLYNAVRYTNFNDDEYAEKNKNDDSCYNLDDEFTFDEDDIVEFTGGYYIRKSIQKIPMLSSWDRSSGFILIFENDNEFPTAIFLIDELGDVTYFNGMIVMAGYNVVIYDTKKGEFKEMWS